LGTARVPPLGPAVPRWGNALTRGLGRALLRLFRWRVTGSVPDVPKLIAIAAPHTCSWDVFVGIAVMLALGARVHWFAKHTTFRWGLGPPLRWLGGISVNRSTPTGAVRDAIDLVTRRDRIVLALAPEGTRRKVANWKTGFYRIALAARAPIVPVALDYSRRAAHIGEPMMPTGDYASDLARLKGHFHSGMARHPERF
jgi:1-acyl-sn-glycerol-3-phosphate acyltransferase